MANKTARQAILSVLNKRKARGATRTELVKATGIPLGTISPTVSQLDREGNILARFSWRGRSGNERVYSI